MLKNKKIQFLIAIVVAVSLIFFQNVFSNNYKLQAKISADSSVSDNKLFGVPYLTDNPSDRGKMLTEYDADKTIILGKTNITSLPGEYSFIPRWTESVAGKNIGTEVLNNGFTEVANAGNGFTGKVYQYSPEDFESKKPANLTYTNVGVFKGKWIDMRLTVTNVEKNSGFNARGTSSKGLLIGGTKNHFNQVRLTKSESTREDQYPNVELTYEYLEHGTENKVEVTGYNVFADVDYRESILVDEKKMNLQNLIMSEDTKLSFKKTDGLLHLMPFIPGVNALEDLANREEAKLSWAAYTFGPTSGYPIIFRMSDSTTMADNEGLLPFETDNPNKVGYDNESTDNEKNVEYSVYQYTPNNGKNYRYNSFTWLDPIHNAIKVENATDIKLKFGQTQEDLPAKYYNVTIDRDVNVPAVSADPEKGVLAEPAGVRDVIRVEFTEAFMTDKDANGNLLMYGEMLEMDIKGTLNSENRLALQSTYSASEKAFVIPNRSELHYTDNISVTEDKKKIISSNTAYSKIKTGEEVQTFVSKKVVNKTAEDNKRPATDKAKVGDILNYEMEVKNLSLVPTNVWKNVTIFDEIESSLDIDTSTIEVTKNGTTEKHPEYYDANNRKLSLPKQDIKPEDTSNLKINFSATINFSASGKKVDNWVYANGVDSLGNPVKDKDNALLAQKVENLIPPTITLNETEGVSTGEAKILSGTFNDPDSESITMYYQVDSGEPVKIVPEYINSPKNNDNSYQFTIPGEKLSHGPHKIIVYGIDSEKLKSNELVYTLKDGELNFISAPKVINFGIKAFDAKVTRIDNPSYDNDLVISDGRGLLDTWTLTAKLNGDMHLVGDVSKVLPDAIRYVYNGQEYKLSNSAIPIMVRKNDNHNAYNISDSWGNKKNDDGFKLEVLPGDVQSLGDYEAEIIWELSATPGATPP
ncbi:hypothetical protein IGJ02_000271 [Enterococcus sp. DIV0724b]|uniref:WxL domain-containing protein n=1 Tax=Enterococcus sp. DIV0724b TaxID=2774694 RepID=UPI003D2FC4F5